MTGLIPDGAPVATRLLEDDPDQDLRGPVAAIGSLWAASVVMQVLAHSSLLLAVMGALSGTLVLIAVLPHGVLYRRSITVGGGSVLFRGLLRRRSILFEHVGSLVASMDGPDPQLLVLSVYGDVVGAPPCLPAARPRGAPASGGPGSEGCGRSRPRCIGKDRNARRSGTSAGANYQPGRGDVRDRPQRPHEIGAPRSSVRSLRQLVAHRLECVFAVMPHCHRHR